MTMKILVAVDGSSFTKRMLAYLAAHDEWLGDRHRYTLVTAVAPIPVRAASAVDKTVLRSYYDDEADKVFKTIRAFFAKQKIQADYVAKVGAPADIISTLAAKGEFDLLMMGSHGHGTLANLVLGSVATKVMAQSKVPVLLIR
jgi:nucleotide-binding universal stress UspA family protein